MNPIKELDCVALTIDLPANGLRRDDVGTVVLVHEDGAGFDLEFVGYQGDTIALVTLDREQVRPLMATDVPHARSLAVA